MPDQGWKGRDSLSSLAVWDCTPSWWEGMSGWLATFHLHWVLKAQPAVPFLCSPEPMWWCSHIQDRSFLSNSSWKTFIDQMCVSIVILGWPSWQWRVTVNNGIYSIVGLCVLILYPGTVLNVLILTVEELLYITNSGSWLYQQNTLNTFIKSRWKQSGLHHQNTSLTTPMRWNTA